MEHFYEDLGGWCGGNDVLLLFREAIKRVRVELPKTIVAGAEPDRDAHFVEVGTFMGKSAAMMAVEIINSGKDIKYDCVDHWLGSPEHRLGGCAQTHEVVHGTLYDVFVENIEPVKDYVNPIKMSSVEASQLYEDESIDFIWLDADHKFESVTEDLEHWYPKLKKGGIFAGHDYAPQWGTHKAVNRFIEKRGKDWDLRDSDGSPLRFVSHQHGYITGVLGKVEMVAGTFWIERGNGACPTCGTELTPPPPDCTSINSSWRQQTNGDTHGETHT